MRLHTYTTAALDTLAHDALRAAATAATPTAAATADRTCAHSFTALAVAERTRSTRAAERYALRVLRAPALPGDTAAAAAVLLAIGEARGRHAAAAAALRACPRALRGALRAYIG